MPHGSQLVNEQPKASQGWGGDLERTLTAENSVVTIEKEGQTNTRLESRQERDGNIEASYLGGPEPPDRPGKEGSHCG